MAAGSNFNASFPLRTDDVCRLAEGSVSLHKACLRRSNVVKQIKQNEEGVCGGGGGGAKRRFCKYIC